MERQMGKNQMISHDGKKEIEIVREGNKKSWITPHLTEINVSTSTEFGLAEFEDAEAGFS